jgi:predicted RNA-binding Zn-ribbon protein involved in translation (DUF1610 family)
VSIRFECQSCKRRLAVEDRRAGRKGKCPNCGNPVLVPPAARELHAEAQAASAETQTEQAVSAEPTSREEWLAVPVQPLLPPQGAPNSTAPDLIPAENESPWPSLAANALACVILIYFVGFMVSLPFFNWKFARAHGFLNWLAFGEIVPTAKAFIWPYYTVRSLLPEKSQTQEREDSPRARAVQQRLPAFEQMPISGGGQKPALSAESSRTTGPPHGRSR